MWPGPALLLLLGLDLGFRGLPPSPTPRRAGTVVSAPVSPSGAAAHGSPPEARPRDRPQGEAAGGALDLSWLSGHARLSLRPLVALGRGVILSGGRGLCFSHSSSRWARRPCFHVRVLLRAPRARRAMPTHVDLHLSAPRGLLSLQWLARLRRSLGPLEWTFHLGPVSPTHASSASGSSPRSTPPGGHLPSAGFMAQTECPTDGLRPIVSEAVNSDNPHAAESSVSCQLARQVLCVIRKVQINKGADGVPLVFTRKMSIFVSAMVDYDCPSAQDRQVEWEVYSVPSLSDAPDWSKPLPVPKLQTRQGLALDILSDTLPVGVYVFAVFLRLVRPTGDLLNGSDHVYATVVRSPLKAVILGDADVTVGFTEELVLDGSASSDPDADDPLQGLQFSWYCTTNPGNYNGENIDVMSREGCLPEPDGLRWARASSSALTLAPQTLKGRRVYFFRMVIQKRDRTAFSDKRVHVLQGPAPVAGIVCTENCDAVLVISHRFSLFLNCTNCTVNRDVYTWSILSPSGDEVAFDWTGQTSTGRNSDYLSVKAFAFRDFVEAQFSLSLALAAWSGVSLVLEYPFVINHVPEIGDCKVSPARGIAFYTKFVIQCTNFKDRNTPFTYKMIVSDLHGFGEISSLKENTLGPILHLGSEHTSPPSFLPIGVLPSHHAMKIFVQVYDSLGAFSQVTLYAAVQAPTDSYSPQTVMQHLLNHTTGPDSVLSALLQKQDFLPAGYLVYIVASVLNSMKAEASLHADKTRLREHLVNATFTFPVSTLVEVGQLVSAVAKLTQKTSEFTSVAQKRATARIWQANQALQEHQRNNTDFQAEQIEIVSTGILTGLSNILKMTTRYQVFADPFIVMQSLADTVLAGKVPGNDTIAMKTSSFNMYVRKMEKRLVTSVLGDEEQGRNWFRATLNVSSAPGLSANAPVSMMFCEFAGDPFPWLNDQDSISADVVGFRMTGTTATGDVLEVAPEVVDVYLGRKDLSSAAFKLTVGPDHAPGTADEALRTTTTGAFRFAVDSRAEKELLVHILTEVTVLFTVSVYAGGQIAPTALVATFLVPHDIPPVAIHSGLFNPACAVKMPRVVCLPPSLLQAVAQRGRSSQSSVVVVLQAPHFVTKPTDKLVRISLFSVHCLDMHGIQRDWREDACVLREKTTWDRVHCVCRSQRRARRQLGVMKLANIPLHVRYFTAKVIVVPNPVDLRLEVIKTIGQNPVALFTVLFIMLTYVALAFWALHRDETDQFLRDHVIVLPDNDPYDNVCYLVTIFTGSRCGSGTRANVFLQLRGTEGASDVHCLSHPHFKSLYRGSINTFLLTTRSDLGDVQAIRVWHNNEGKAPSWYLSRVKVENLFSRHIWLFLCRAWLSINTSVDRTFAVTEPNVPLERADFFLIDVTNQLGRAHLWFSVFTGAVGTGFGRLQRLSCCLAMLLASLLCNIMFFNLNAEEGAGPGGGRYLRSMVIGLESAVITLPVQVAITGLFTYSQRPPQVSLDKVSPRKYPTMAAEAGHWEDRLKKWHAQETSEQPPPEQPPPGTGPGLRKSFVKKTSKAGPRRKKAKSRGPRTIRSNANDNNRNVNNSLGAPAERPPTPEHPPPPASKPRVALPRRCVYVAWFLVFATSGVSSFFIVLYGLTYGYERSIEWLFASFCSFCQSVFVVQPFKIMVLSSIRSNRPKYCKNLSWVSNYCYTEIQLQDVRLDPDKMQQRHQHVLGLRDTRMYQPLTEDEIRIFKRKRATKRRAWLLLTCILTHLVFLALLLSLAALLRRTDSFHHNQFIRRQFSEGLAAVTQLDDVYLWLSSVTLPLFHNDLHPTFLPDSSSQILGLPLMRQVRAKDSHAGKACLPAHSSVPDSIRGEIHCHPMYGRHPEDTANYTGFWKKIDKRTTDKNTQGFTYKPPERTWVYYSYGLLHTYGSGGYAFYFFPDQQRFNSTLRLKDLQNSHWLDEKTWAVILDLTTFTPGVSLFCSVSVVFEVSPLGVVNASVSVHSFSLSDFSRKSAEVALYAAILVCFLAYVAHEVYTVWQERASYVTRACNWLSLALVCAFAALIVLFSSKHFLAAGVIRSYSSNSGDFVPFHAISRADHVMGIALGFLLFLTILKMLRYCRFLFSVRLAQRATRAALPAICHVALMLSLCFFVYVAFGCLVFGQHEWNYSRSLHAAQTVLSYCVSAFQNVDFSHNRALGVLFLSTFILLVICTLINLFRATILSAHEEMTQPVYEQPSDEAEAMAYLCGKLRTMVGFLSFRPKAPDKPTIFMDMLYGRPERHNRRFLGLKTRNINERKMVYLVV